jgi:hypothetical protein
VRTENYLGFGWSEFQIYANEQKLENDSNAIDSQYQDVFGAITD